MPRHLLASSLNPSATGSFSANGEAPARAHGGSRPSVDVQDVFARLGLLTKNVIAASTVALSLLLGEVLLIRATAFVPGHVPGMFDGTRSLRCPSRSDHL